MSYLLLLIWDFSVLTQSCGSNQLSWFTMFLKDGRVFSMHLGGNCIFIDDTSPLPNLI